MGAAEQLWPDVMDLNTAAKYLNVHPVTLRDWKRQGKGPPGRKMEGRWRFHRPTLDAYLTGCPASLPRTALSPVARKASSTSGLPRPADSR